MMTRFRAALSLSLSFPLNAGDTCSRVSRGRRKWSRRGKGNFHGSFRTFATGEEDYESFLRSLDTKESFFFSPFLLLLLQSKKEGRGKAGAAKRKKTHTHTQAKAETERSKVLLLLLAAGGGGR